jgi:hypothetical protein
VIDTSLKSRATSFENVTGAKGAGGAAHGGRKGAPSKRLAPRERVVLADLEGSGIVRHLWMTFPPAPPERLRSLVLEVFYGGAAEPSVSVPVVDFFGLPHGRPVALTTALTTVQEARGYNSWIPMPFRDGIRIELVNDQDRPNLLYYQVDYTLQDELPADLGHLHVSFRRQNPTTLRDDFVIAEGLRGPGRFLGCNVGVRVIDHADWYGEGEVKVYLDGDADLPTICGTGLEDYVGTAWGLGAHQTPWCGAPLVIGENVKEGQPIGGNPDLVGFYRWHLPDPIVFESSLRVTIQQIGAKFFAAGQEEQLAAYEKTNPVAGEGWVRGRHPAMLAWGLAERVDDFCATAYVYCRDPQPVPRVDVAAVTADIERRHYEPTNPAELLAGVINPDEVPDAG